MKTKPLDRTAEYRKGTLETIALGRRYFMKQKLELFNCVLGCLPIMPNDRKDALRRRFMRSKIPDLKTVYRLLK